MRLFLGALLLAVTLAACGGPSAPRTAPRPLPADSAALLERALQRVRPAFATQAEALRAGVYGGTPAPHYAAGTVNTSPRPAKTRGAFVIQLAAYRDRGMAESSAREAERRFPGRSVLVEPGEGGVFRIALAGWPTRAAAEAELASVRRVYGDAWIRHRAGS